MLACTNANDRFRLVQIGSLAAKQGFRAEMFEALDAALAAKADPDRVKRILEPLAEQALDGTAGARRSGVCQELLSDLAKNPGPARELYGSLVFSKLTTDDAMRELRYAFASASPVVRRFASETWGKVAPADKWETLVKRTLADGDSGVREAASKALGASPEASAAAAKLARSLFAPSPTLRLRSAEALGNLGTLEAVPSLVKHWTALQAAGGAAYAPRAFLSVGEQQAYVADYDVQVAQAAAIADPVVSTLQSGAVLDVRVLGVDVERVVTLEKRAAREALVKIAGMDLGDDPRAWARWFAEKQSNAGAASPRTPGSSTRAPSRD